MSAAASALSVPALARRSRNWNAPLATPARARAASNRLRSWPLLSGWVGRTTLEQRQYRERCRDRLESLKKKCWPVSTLESLPTLAGAIVQELTSKGACRSCGGVGKRVAGEHLLVCPECGGEGVAEVSDRQRAALIGRDESTYRAKWRVVYEWMFDRMSAAEATAADQLARALSRHAA